MDFDKVISHRKMIREYIANKQIPEEMIIKFVKNAHRAPSAGHTQEQEFIVVKDGITKKKLRKVANQEYVEMAPASIIVCSNTSRSVNRYGTRGREFYSIIDVLLHISAVNEGISAAFVGAFEDEKASKSTSTSRYYLSRISCRDA